MDSLEGSGLLTLDIHYDGLLQNHSKGRYIGGKSIQAHLSLCDYLIYDDVAKVICEKTANVANIYYREHYYGPFKQSLRILGCQSDLVEMLVSINRRMDPSNCLIDIYVQHIDGYESDTPSLEHMSDEDDELYEFRRQKIEEKKKKQEAKEKRRKGKTALGEEHIEPAQGQEQDHLEIPNWDDEEPLNDDIPPNGEPVNGWEDNVIGNYELNMEQIGWSGIETVVRDDSSISDSDSVRSEYPSSDDYDSPTMGSDDDELQRMAPYFPIFNNECDPFKYVPTLGMRFKDPTQLKDVLRYYAVENKLGIRFAVSKSRFLIAKCKPKCTWRLYASWMKEESSFQIKSLIEEHKCTKTYRIKIANSRWIAKVFHNRLINNPRLKWKELKVEVKDRYKLEVTYRQCGKAKKFAMGEVEDIMKEHYAKLWDYAAEIKSSIPGSSVTLLVDRPTLDSPGQFQRMYICLGPLKKCWREGCRPVIGVDGCFLKTYCKGELLTAIGRDGNNWMFPIAWAVVESETKDAWIWFLEQLSADLFLGDGGGYTIISDQQKGLESAINLIFPKIEHRMCARHVYANFRGIFSGGHLKTLFWAAAKCGTEKEFNDIMEKIGQASSEAKDYLLKKKNPSQWCRAWYGTQSGCDSVENNMCETFNGVIVEARTFKIIDMLEYIRKYITKRMQNKAKEIEKWEGTVCPRIMKKMEKIEAESCNWNVTYCGGHLYEVTRGRHGYKVDLTSRTCSCRLWDVSGLPCIHAHAVILDNREEKDDYVAGWFKIEKIKQCYSDFLPPLNGENLWPKTEFQPFLPPKDRRMAGRPKKARRKSKHESPHKGINLKNVKVVKAKKVSRVGRKNQCSICKEYGHNKATCKNKDATQSSTIEPHGGDSTVNVTQSSTTEPQESQNIQTQAPHPLQQSQNTQSKMRSQNVVQATTTAPMKKPAKATNRAPIPKKSVQHTNATTKPFKPPSTSQVRKSPLTMSTTAQVRRSPLTRSTTAQVRRSPLTRNKAQNFGINLSDPLLEERRHVKPKRMYTPNNCGVYNCPNGGMFYRGIGAKRGRFIPNQWPKNQPSTSHQVQPAMSHQVQPVQPATRQQVQPATTQVQLATRQHVQPATTQEVHPQSTHFGSKVASTSTVRRTLNLG